MQYKYKVINGHYYFKKKRLKKGETFISNLPLHLTIKNKFQLLEELNFRKQDEEPKGKVIIDPADEEEVDELIEEAEAAEIEAAEETKADDEGDFIDLPLKLQQKSAKRWNVLDANSNLIKGNITRKTADALIAEYEEAAED